MLTKSGVRGRRIRLFVKLALLLSVLTFPLIARAQSYSFHIPAQGLIAALKQFGIQADRQVLFSPELVAGRKGNAVIGNYDATSALEMLLSGTGLTYEATASNVVVIKADPKEGASPATRVVPKRPAVRAETEIEEITVTAQKREENIQEIPISVTALSGTALEERGVVELVDLQTTVPNMRTELSSTGNASFYAAMRGTANVNNSLSQSSTVGLHLDGVYIAKNQANAMDLEDLERVEVLRGPQGTLFGRNTTGGAINLITKKPTEERSVTASTQVGNYDAFKARLTVNVPLIGKNGYFQSDALGTLSLRENVVYRSHEPYVDNKSPTNVPASGTAGLNNLNRVFNMTALRWQPTKDFTVDYAFEYHRFRQAPAAS